MRAQLAKSLQSRCKAIQRAVAAYNTAALALDPPRDPLDWSNVSNYGFIEEFAMLRNTRNDISEKPWVKPLFREMLKMRQRIARAKEEITRCNVEVRRVYTSICDESKLFSRVLNVLRATKDPRYGPVDEYVTRRKVTNRALLKRVEQIHSLRGFTGDRRRGVRIGSEEVIPDINDGNEIVQSPNSGDDSSDESGDEDSGVQLQDLEDDDEVHEAAGRMDNFYANLD